jgi:alcohol dehydrogenase (cytochrome c)
MTSKINPTAATAKWFNPKAAGSTRDVVVALGESGGVFALDRKTGEFLWANPWPYDVPEFLIKKVDPDGKVWINEERMLKGPNQENFACFFNTRSYWPVAYSPVTNSVYAPWTDTCNYEQTKDLGQRSSHGGKIRPGSNPNEFSGVSKINVETGKIDHIYKGPMPINGAMLATEGGLVFFGDLNRHFRALDAESGKVLWDQAIGGPIQSSTITYAVNGKQYVAVQTGDGQLTGSVEAYVPGLKVPKGHNAIYVFALP